MSWNQLQGLSCPSCNRSEFIGFRREPEVICACGHQFAPTQTRTCPFCHRTGVFYTPPEERVSYRDQLTPYRSPHPSCERRFSSPAVKVSLICPSCYSDREIHPIYRGICPCGHSFTVKPDVRPRCPECYHTASVSKAATNRSGSQRYWCAICQHYFTSKSQATWIQPRASRRSSAATHHVKNGIS